MKGIEQDFNYNAEYLNNKPVYDFFKRIFDLVLAILALLVLLLPLLLLALIIFIDSPKASPIFIQKRVGKNGKVFNFYKFRSMVPNAENMLNELLEQNEMEGPVFKMKNDPRITRVGRFIRPSSIDELPQLINIIKGDMSFVGPRPPLVREVELYDEKAMQRLNVIPGLTGYWQIQPSRNSLDFDEWLKLDFEYIKKRSFLLDIKIILKTFLVVFGMEGQ